MRNASWLLAAAFFVLGVLSCAQGLRNAVRPGGSQDLQWGVSRLLLNHQSPYASFVEFKVGKLTHNPFPEVPLPVYPASAEIFLWPLAAFDFNYAKWLWAVANILFAIGTVVLLARLAGLSGIASLGLLGLFLASTPVRTTIGNGQHGLFSFFFFLLAVTLQYRSRTPLAALCLAVSWFKYTITFPLSLIFARREWRATLAIAAMVHCGLTLFLAFWTRENPLILLLGPLMLMSDAVSATMFDVMAIATYIGMPSPTVAMLVSIALFIALAVLMIKRNGDLLADLSLLSVVSLIWSYHWQYDYFVLIIPLTFALKRWQQGTADFADALIALSTLFVWFALRLLDAAVLWSPEKFSIEVVRQIVFWIACLATYTTLVSYLRRTYWATDAESPKC